MEISFKKNKYFVKKGHSLNNETWELRKENSREQMPDILLQFEIDGIYICKNNSYTFWNKMECLKEFIKIENLEIKSIEEL